MRRRVTLMVDRHQGTFVIFHRNGEDVGRTYYQPSMSSMQRFATALGNLIESKELVIWSGSPGIHAFEVRRVARRG